MVLAAGLGTRMRPLTLLRAKPALPVMNRPLLHWTLDLLARNGVTEVMINLHHLPWTVMEAVGDGSVFGAARVVLPRAADPGHRAAGRGRSARFSATPPSSS